MNGKSLLDTNIVISIFKDEKNIAKRIRALRKVYIPVVVLGELYYGAFKSMRIEKNLNNISLLLDHISVLQTNEGTAKIYGEIKTQLKRKGKPIPENDIWVAAIARQFNLTLITKDGHFKEVDGLKYTLL
jgi:tRNA(fMet)-specific endonuclease VapC